MLSFLTYLKEQHLLVARKMADRIKVGNQEIFIAICDFKDIKSQS